MIRAFVKIFSIGTDYIKDIFENEVEITEKIDGSQFVFGRVDGTLYMRSKGSQIFPEAPEKMFTEAVEHVMSIQHRLPKNLVFYCEYLKKPKHNMLAYERIPQNHLSLFGICNEIGLFTNAYDLLQFHARQLDIECVPLLYKGKIETHTQLIELLMNTKSTLGNVRIEGIVVKNYFRPFLLGGQPIPLMAGKFVSEKFKEIHREGWKAEETSKGKLETFKEGFRTEARWEKALQHLTEIGQIENAPRDIGKLVAEVKRDIEEEEKEYIKEWLYKQFGSEVLRKSIAGLPEWYKRRLMGKSFEVET